MKISLTDLEEIIREEVIRAESIKSSIDLTSTDRLASSPWDPHQVPYDNLYDASPKTDRDQSSLNPYFSGIVTEIFTKLRAKGWNPGIRDAYRSVEDQISAIKNGHSLVNDPLHSKHTALTETGKKNSYAVDIADNTVWPPDTQITSSSPNWLRLMKFFSDLGEIVDADHTGQIEWGGDWTESRIQQPRYDLSWKSNSPMGWDPGHINLIVNTSEMRTATAEGLRALGGVSDDTGGTSGEDTDTGEDTGEDVDADTGEVLDPYDGY